MINFSQFCFFITVLFPCASFGKPASEWGENLSLNKPVESSGDLGATDDANYKASNAVDGNPDTIFHSNSKGDTWWAVDLRTVAYVSRIDIYNRIDCGDFCEGRLNGAVISIMNDMGEITNTKTIVDPEEVYTWDLAGSGIEARFVNITHDVDFLHFNDVEVFGLSVAHGYQDLVQENNRVTSSGAIPGKEASKAVDGHHHTLYHSDDEYNQWWQMDLGEIASIRQITIYNREDCCWDRLNNATLHLLDVDGTVVESRTIDYPADVVSDIVTLSFPYYPMANMIKIELDRGFLHFRELEVYGSMASDGQVNLARNKPATQKKSLSPEWGPLNAVQDSDFSAVNHSFQHGWWNVDLLVNALISNIKVVNRHDCCWERLKGATVTIMDERGTPVATRTVTDDAPEFVTFTFNNVLGRFVFIEQIGDNLALGEVQVYGAEVSSSGAAAAEAEEEEQ